MKRQCENCLTTMSLSPLLSSSGPWSPPRPLPRFLPLPRFIPRPPFPLPRPRPPFPPEENKGKVTNVINLHSDLRFGCIPTFLTHLALGPSISCIGLVLLSSHRSHLLPYCHSHHLHTVKKKKVN